MTQPAAPADLYGLASGLLSGVAEFLAELGVDVPDRRYVLGGAMVAYDCEQLTLAVLSIRPGTPGGITADDVMVLARTCYVPHYLTARLELVREVPEADAEGNPPDAADIDASGRVMLGDLASLEQAVLAVATGIAGIGVPVALGPVLTVGPEGGIAATRIDVDLPLPLPQG